MTNLDEHIGYVPEFSKGDKVWDDLTSSEAIVTEVLLRAYKLDSEYLEGYRFAWEVSVNKNQHRGDKDDKKTKFNDHKLMGAFLKEISDGSLEELEYIEEKNGVKFEVITSHGGEGDSCGFILKVTEGDQSALVRIEGYYNSYDGSNYEDAEVDIVEPKQVEITQYFKVKF